MRRFLTSRHSPVRTQPDRRRLRELLGESEDRLIAMDPAWHCRRNLFAFLVGKAFKIAALIRLRTARLRRRNSSRRRPMVLMRSELSVQPLRRISTLRTIELVRLVRDRLADSSPPVLSFENQVWLNATDPSFWHKFTRQFTGLACGKPTGFVARIERTWTPDFVNRAWPLLIS
jgi:hypothetical protein